MIDLKKQLLEYSRSEYYPFHMPGHKRNMDWDIAHMDITEIDGFDNLHHANGILRDCQKQYAGLVGAKETYFLVNGSTCGILAAISACTDFGGKLLMARNAHKSAYHALYLRHLHPVYLYPGVTLFDLQGAITPEQVETALAKESDIQAVFLTSPTYDGVVSDIGRIAQIVHAAGKILIVDEAHGAHFGFINEFPDSAIHLGADVVIQSVHKTLPALTQTAVLHICSDRVKKELIERFLGIYETSSPSYVLMSSVNQCEQIMRRSGRELLMQLYQNLQWFYEQTKDLQVLRVLTKEDFSDAYAKDPSKILIQTAKTDINAATLDHLLRTQFSLEMEMCSGEYVTALTSVYDTKEGFERLSNALRMIDCTLHEVSKKQPFVGELYAERKQIIPICEAWPMDGETIPISECVGKVSLDFVYLYPPGIPLLVPGEEIDGSLPEKLVQCRKNGLELQGMKDPTGEYLAVTDKVCKAPDHQLY